MSQANLNLGVSPIDEKKRYLHIPEMNVMRTLSLLLIITIAAIAGCKKSEPYINPVFECNCGSVQWNDREIQLLMAEYVESEPGNIFSRRYYLTADLRQPGDEEAHNLNIQIGIDSLTGSQLFIPEQEVFTLFEEVNKNDELSPLRAYVATQGFIGVNAAILGGEERVQYQMILKEVVNGQLVGFDIAVSGSFTVLIEP